MGTLQKCEPLIDIFLTQDEFDNIKNGKLIGGRFRNNYVVYDNEVMVELTKGYFMLCDLEDWNKLKDYVWCFDTAGGYATSRKKVDYFKVEKITFHGEVLELQNVDHISRNRLDNRRSNLR